MSRKNMYDIHVPEECALHDVTVMNRGGFITAHPCVLSVKYCDAHKLTIQQYFNGHDKGNISK